MFKFTASFFLAIFALLAVATSFVSASALPVNSLEKKNQQHICELVNVKDVDVALAAIVAAKGVITADLLVQLDAAVEVCADAIVAAKAVIDADVVVDATAALFVAIEAVLVDLDLAVVAKLLVNIDLDVKLKAILDAIVLIKVDANVDVGLALAIAVLQVFADIKVFVFLKDLDLTAIVIAALGLVGIL
ncbi:hypothetical protein SISNIDRAFT_550349 [Sistotremastrum niveocremeum HHB9708]|uniref:Transmembrane protein n=1 Tax=Sistotremastrum niveocremeum HHB9708 TaxID=1314777 RepID=A0A164U1L4_9AGAM|nr:hypothetical protein SISNIDRAFT_550349 [Sistotremastrum niveocremeum HHB9708]